MKRTTTMVIALWAMLATLNASAQKGSEQEMIKKANTLFNSGEYLKAYPLFSQLVSLYPNHAEYNYKFGACAIYSEPDKSKAVKYLLVATKQQDLDPMAWYYLGKAQHLNYNFKDAISAYETFMRKADMKVAVKTDAQRSIETCIYGSNLLSNIKDISVIERKEADKQNFFRYMDLAGIGGKILTVPDALKSKLDLKSTEPGVMHYPGNSSTIYFSSYGKDGLNGKDIYKAQVLADGKFSEPVKIEGGVNTKYDEDYCFMHSDGKTLYFASKGHNSMGGYDIFKSEMDPATGKFGPAINLDFAINTPDDDIFYISDSLNQRAYFASARSSDQAHINVYNVLVEASPLQVVYLKGTFANQMNPDMKRANIKVRSELSGKLEMEAGTQGGGGNYLLYVSKPGDYTFKVKPEGSAQEHEVLVKIPSFEKPVALRQEMMLVSDNGKERLQVVNHFEIPLNEDIASLAAEMLRRKSGLEVNVSGDVLANLDNNPKPTENFTSLPKTMDNAPLAAGYGDGITVKSVVMSMEMEHNKLRTFLAESDKKYDSGYSFAQAKHKEADALLVKAEQIRKGTSNYTTEEDIKKLKESTEMVAKAEALKREAKAAMVAAESVKQYKESEAERAKDIESRMLMLKQADATGNFDVAVEQMRAERSRLEEIRSGNSNSPYDQLLAKAKAKEAEAQKAEQRMLSLRDEQKELKEKVSIAESKMNTAKKKADQQAAEAEYVKAKSDLDNVKRNIASQNTKIKILAAEAKDAYANAELYKKLSDDTSLGMKSADITVLSETEKNLLNMKLKEMDTRVAALEISDPKTLALITDSSMDSGAIVARTEVRETSDSPAKAVSSTNATTEQPTQAKPEAVVTPIQSTVKSSGEKSAQTIKTEKDAALAKIGNGPNAAPARRMMVSASLLETNSAIKQLEYKKQQGTFSTKDDQDLKELVALKNQLQAEQAALPATNVSTTPEALKMAYNAANPGYTQKLQEINNGPGSEISRTMTKMEYKKQTIAKLQELRMQNATQAVQANDVAQINAFAQKDAQYEAAMRALENETNDVNQYRSAYEFEKKSIIESNDLIAAKLQEQIDITEDYLSVLDRVEAAKQKELEMAVDQQESVALRMQIGEIKKEQAEANAKLHAYLKDYALTTATSDVKPMSTSVANNTRGAEKRDLEDAVLANEAEQSVEEKEEAKKQVEQHAEMFGKMFKPRVESESIFAYESGSFEEIVARHQNEQNKLKNRDKIQSLNDQIFLVEAEMEITDSDSKLRKLDYKAEQLYFKRAMLEIENAPAIGNMTQAAYQSELSKSKELTAINKEKIDSRILLRDEVKALNRVAEDNMVEAAQLRLAAPKVTDEIEKADYYRQAFAKEALAIEKLKQIVEINENIDALLLYSDLELAQLRTGKVPSASLEQSMTAKVNHITSSVEAKSTAGSNDAIATNTSDASKNAAATGNNNSVNEQKSTVTGEVKVTPLTAGITNKDNPATSNASSATSTNQSATSAAATAKNETVAEQRGTEIKTMEQPSQKDEVAVVRSVSVAVAPDTKSNTNSTATQPTGTERKTVGENSLSFAIVPEKPDVRSEEKSETKTAIVTTEGKQSTGTSNTVKVETLGSAPTTKSAVAANTTKATAVTKPSAMASDYAYADEDYFFSAPEYLVKDIFKRTTRAVYSESKPIPVDIPMPKGVYYKVQVGAFRNKIPQNLYDEFAPVCGETLNNGITRYTAGFFMEFKNADDVKRQIRAMGYSDAFVVAFRDGKRIPLYEAMGKTNPSDFQANIEKEYIYGDAGEAPKRNSEKSNTSVDTKSNNASNNVNGSAQNNKAASNAASNALTSAPKVNYYPTTPDVAKAKEVETVKGLFYTVQVGVYSKAVPAKSMYDITPLNSELTETKKIRYTSGRYTSLADAVNKRAEARELGIGDAFITAYYNGKRITLSEADLLLKENGNSILMK